MTNGTMESKTPLACSFCGKFRNQVAKLVAGPNIYICNECVDLCREICDDDGTDEKVRKKKDRVRRQAILRLKSLVKKGSSVYTVSGGTHILVVKNGEIIDASEMVCDIFDRDVPQNCNVRELSKILFGSRRQLKKKRLL